MCTSPSLGPNSGLKIKKLAKDMFDFCDILMVAPICDLWVAIFWIIQFYWWWWWQN